jgi:hypothetical protein
MMVEYDVDVEVGEYQWRRKFETREQHHARAFILPITAVSIVVLACSTYWW